MEDPQGLLLPPGAGPAVALGGLGVVFKLVEHPLAPRTLAAPVHTHSREDEYSYVLDGTVVVQLGDRRLTAAGGAVVRKPRASPTPSGTPQTRRPGCWRSSRRAAPNATSRRSPG
jgi:Cupin domain